jgi:hypothetical protein
VREHVFEGEADGVVACRRRRRVIVGGEFPFVPTPEELVPRRVVVG